MTEHARPRIPFRRPSRAAELLLFGSSVVLVISVASYIGDARAYVLGLSVCMIGILILFSWPLSREVWFWITTAGLLVLHLAATFGFDWAWVDAMRSGVKLLALFMTADLFVMVGITYGIYRLKYGVPVETMLPSIEDLPRYDQHDLDL